MKKLPKTVFVTWDESPNDGPWLAVHEKETEAIDGDGPQVVGKYELVEVAKLSKEVVRAK